MLQALTQDVAATRIQAAVRGMLCRRRHSGGEEQAELAFLGMVPSVRACPGAGVL